MALNSSAVTPSGLMPIAVSWTRSLRRTSSSQISIACDVGRLNVESTISKVFGLDVARRARSRPRHLRGCGSGVSRPRCPGRSSRRSASGNRVWSEWPTSRCAAGTPANRSIAPCRSGQSRGVVRANSRRVPIRRAHRPRGSPARSRRARGRARARGRRPLPLQRPRNRPTRIQKPPGRARKPRARRRPRARSPIPGRSRCASSRPPSARRAVASSSCRCSAPRCRRPPAGGFGAPGGARPRRLPRRADRPPRPRDLKLPPHSRRRTGRSEAPGSNPGSCWHGRGRKTTQDRRFPPSDRSQT